MTNVGWLLLFRLVGLTLVMVGAATVAYNLNEQHETADWHVQAGFGAFMLVYGLGLLWVLRGEVPVWG